MPALVSDPDLVTPEWLTEVLVSSGALGDGDVVSFTSERVGTGQVGCNVRFALTYEPTGAGPASVVGKFASPDEASRSTGIQTLTYETEVAFYRDLADTIDIRRPHCHFAAVVAGTADVVLVLEDLAPAVQGDQIEGCTVEQARLAMVEAARLHGPRWDDPSLAELPWLHRRWSDGAGMVPAYEMFWSGFAGRYRDTLTAEALDIGSRVGSHLPALAQAGRSAPVAPIHNDYRLDNMLFGTDEGGAPLAVVDWQTVGLGCGTADVAYFLGAGLRPEVRAAHERELVGLYHETLTGYGVSGYPFERCWDDYRRYTFTGFLMAVFASMMVGQTDRGDAMFMAMANRSAAQIAHLGSEALL